MYHSAHNQPAFPVPDGDDPGITVWQYYKAAAIACALTESGDSVSRLPEEVVDAAEAIADAAVEGDRARNQGNY